MKHRLKMLLRETWARLLFHTGLWVVVDRIAPRRLLILAGPTLDHDGPQAVYGLDWPPRQPGVGEIRTPRRLVDLPATPGADKAEGLARVDIGGGSRILVVYDSPAASRFDEAAGRITADLFDLADA